MGIWQPPLIASQLTIDTVVGGVATPGRSVKKKAQVRWSAVSFCTRHCHQGREMRIRRTCSGRLVPESYPGTCEEIFAFNSLEREPIRQVL
jgi:hypothetical protein